MKICVPFKYWEAALKCAAVDDVRFYLNGIHLNKDRIESTNGHVAYSAEFGKHDIDGQERLDGQCGFTNFKDYNGLWPDVIIGSFGSAPTKAQSRKAIWLLIESDGEDDLLIKYIDNCANVIFIQSAKLIDARYPDFKRIEPKGRAPKDQFNVGFNPEYLALPAKILEREGSRFPGQCIFTAYGETKSAKIELKRATSECKKELLILMPMHIR